MNINPIIIVDDDADDRDFLQDAFKELNYHNELIFFKDGETVLKFLDTEKLVTFLILFDVNLPNMDGFELKDHLLHHDSTRYTSIPFVFWSTTISNAQVQKAYDLGVNGIFLKENSFDGLKTVLGDIMNYWGKSKVPY